MPRAAAMCSNAVWPSAWATCSSRARKATSAIRRQSSTKPAGRRTSRRWVRISSSRFGRRTLPRHRRLRSHKASRSPAPAARTQIRDFQFIGLSVFRFARPIPMINLKTLLVLALGALGSALPLHAADSAPAKPPEITPITLPGAESFIYRDGERPMRLFIVKPKDWKAGDRRPALVFFFGGGWTTGTPASSVSWARFAAKLGFVGIAPDYRTKGRFDTPPQMSVADARASLRWVQEHAAELGIDSARIAVGGNSAGGHVALWTALSSVPPGSDPAESPLAKPAALVLFSTVSDTSPANGYTPKRFGTDATALSPVHQLDAAMPPVLAFHGDADKLVSVNQAIALREKLVASGNHCELHVVPGGGHNFGNDVPEWQQKSRDLMQEFLQRRFK